MREAGERLRRVVREVAPQLESISDEAAGARPAPGKWSPREVLGHLIDSASNNHPRFVLGQSAQDLVFPGYEADAWVAAQGYDERPWGELVALWRTFNLHLAAVMTRTPEDVRGREHARHNFDQIGWGDFSTSTPATLDQLMHDYVGHLLHHLRQIRGLPDAAG